MISGRGRSIAGNKAFEVDGNLMAVPNHRIGVSMFIIDLENE